MSAKTVLIIGANRGIGFQFVKTLTERRWNVIGSVRPQTREDPSVKELEATGARIVELDYKVEQTFRDVASDLAQVKLDLLINCAGIAVQPPSWTDHAPADLMERFQVMTVGPFLATRYFLPLLEKEGGGKIANISSSSGSITKNDDSRFIGYKMAKCALNMQSVTFANDFKEKDIPVIIACFQPGWVKTQLTRFTGNVDIVESVTGMLKVVDSLQPEDSGRFFDWKGGSMPCYQPLGDEGM